MKQSAPSLEPFLLFGEEWSSNPHVVWDRIRGKETMGYTSSDGGVYMPVRFDDIRAIAFDYEVFSSCQITVSRPPVTKPFHMPPMSADPPAHRIYRDLLQSFFSLKNVGLFETVTESAAKRWLQAAAVSTEVEYVGGIILPYVIDVFLSIFGVPDAEKNAFSDDLRRVSSMSHLDVEALRLAMIPLEYKLKDVIRYRREIPGNDLTSVLNNARSNGALVPPDIILMLLRLIVIAGIPTSVSSIAEGVAVLSHEDNRRAAIASEFSWKHAVEEIFRVSSPAMLSRRCMRDQVVGGHLIEAGKTVLLPYAAGNRDPSVFESPHRIVLDRKRNRHMAFGFGIHSCLGAHLARVLSETFLRCWMQSVARKQTLSIQGETWTVGPVHGRSRMVVRSQAAR